MENVRSEPCCACTLLQTYFLILGLCSFHILQLQVVFFLCVVRFPKLTCDRTNKRLERKHVSRNSIGVNQELLNVLGRVVWRRASGLSCPCRDRKGRKSGLASMIGSYRFRPPRGTPPSLPPVFLLSSLHSESRDDDVCTCTLPPPERRPSSNI